MNDLLLSHQELTENPTARVPICLVLDVSYSMNGAPIEELNAGVELFMDEIARDDIAAAAAEICIVTFGKHVERVVDFGSIERQEVHAFQANGLTPMGEAVEVGLDLLENRKRMYQELGVDYYQPWLVVMTDGAPTDDIQAAAARTRELVNGKKLTVFPIGIGPSADLNVLGNFSPLRSPVKLKGLEFRKFFEWLSKSVSAVSVSTPGERVTLPPVQDYGWGEL